MTVSVEELADFLRVRIAEDEAQASGVERHESMGRGLRGLWVTDLDGERTMILGADPARVLAECEAKRRIVEDGLRAIGDWAPGSPMVGYRAAMRDAMCATALPYADHPDYREEWRPWVVGR